MQPMTCCPLDLSLLQAVCVCVCEAAGGSVFFCRLVFKIVEFINIDNLSSGLGDWECVCLCESVYRHLHVSVLCVFLHV